MIVQEFRDGICFLIVEAVLSKKLPVARESSTGSFLFCLWMKSAGLDLRISLTVEDVYHIGIRLHLAAHHLRENARCAAGNKRHALLIHLYGLLLVAGLDVPEHDLRQTVAVSREELLSILKVCKGRIPCTPVELHVRNDIHCRR